jgi:hypothetical protein
MNFHPRNLLPVICTNYIPVSFLPPSFFSPFPQINLSVNAFLVSSIFHAFLSSSFLPPQLFPHPSPYSRLISVMRITKSNIILSLPAWSQTVHLIIHPFPAVIFSLLLGKKGIVQYIPTTSGLSAFCNSQLEKATAATGFITDEGRCKHRVHCSLSS